MDEKLIDKIVDILARYIVENWTKDNFKEDKVKREKGKFAKSYLSKRIDRVKSRCRKPLKISDYEKAVLRDTVAKYPFTKEEIKNGYTKRNTYFYLYSLKIDDASSLMYTPIKRIKI